MHVLLKHARRVVLGVAVGALLLAAAPGSDQSGHTHDLRGADEVKRISFRLTGPQFAQSSDHMG